MRRAISIAALAAAQIFALASAEADVTISTAATQNMTCANGVCTPTATNAVLNVTDLENLLASGDVMVETTGSGVQANNIDVQAQLSWSTTSTLAFDAYESIVVDRAISVSGAGGLSIASNDGGSGGYFAFGANGDATFPSLSSALTINGANYTLVGDIATLAADIAANPAGNYALANAYDAKKDGTYENSPITMAFAGTFNGLGNAISNLKINDTTSGDYDGLFAEVGSGSAVGSVTLLNEKINGDALLVGGLVALNEGTIANSFVGVTFLSKGTQIGELAGYSEGSIARSGAIGSITSGNNSTDGCLAGENASGTISQSYADCKISAGEVSAVGGLAGANFGSVNQSYAVGRSHSATGSIVGGLVGENSTGAMIFQTYSTTTVKREAGGRDSGYRGGLIGADYSSSGSNTNDYWDTSTSKVPNRADGAGTPKNDSGITGQTSAQLQSGLPSGFDPTVWAEDPKINNGFPYLIANPPRE